MDIRVFDNDNKEFKYYSNAKKVRGRGNEDLFLVRELGNNVYFDSDQVQLNTYYYDFNKEYVYTGDVVMSPDPSSVLDQPRVVFVINDNVSVLIDGKLVSLSQKILEDAFVITNINEDDTAKAFFEAEFDLYKESVYQYYFVVAATQSAHFRTKGKLGYAYSVGKKGGSITFNGGVTGHQDATGGMIIGLTEALKTIPRNEFSKITINTPTEYLADIINGGLIHLWHNRGWVKRGPDFGEVAHKEELMALREELLDREVIAKVIDYKNHIFKETQKLAGRYYYR